jgi:hypothetical protein
MGFLVSAYYAACISSAARKTEENRVAYIMDLYDICKKNYNNLYLLF